MKYAGEPLRRPMGRTVLLPRGAGEWLTLYLEPLPLGFSQQLREHGVTPPQPPTRIARDSQGRPLRDANGHVTTLSDVQDAHYLAELERHHQRTAVLSIHAALRSDPQVSFDTLLPAEGDWNSAADDLFLELQHAGLAAGDLVLLTRAVCDLSNLLDEHLRQSQETFFDGAPGNSS